MKKEAYHKPVRVISFQNNYYIELLNTKVAVIETLSVKGYRNKISPYLKDIICNLKNLNNLKRSDTCKFQLTIANNFISYIDNDEERVMYSKGVTWNS